VGSAAQIKAIKQVAGKVKLELAQFRELAAFAQFGSDLDAKTQAQLNRGSRIVELFKQPAANPIPFEEQVATLWAMQNGFFNDIDIKKVTAAALALRAYFSAQQQALLQKIAEKQALDGGLEAELKAACEGWKETQAKAES
jgi:F-type H+-transporting ATPase subunit alpha